MMEKECQPPSKLNKRKNRRGILSLHPSLIVRWSATPNHRGPRASIERPIPSANRCTTDSLTAEPVSSRQWKYPSGFAFHPAKHCTCGRSRRVVEYRLWGTATRDTERGSRGSPLLPFLLLLLLYFILLTRPVSEERYLVDWEHT